MAVHQRTRTRLPHVRAGLEVPGRAGADRAAEHRHGTLGRLGSRDGRFAGAWRRPLYLCSWMRQSGLADRLPSLRDTVWVGLSAGSLVMPPRIGADFVRWTPPTGGDATLGVVDFAICPHLDHPALPENTMADAEKWAAGMSVPCYAIDDETAIKVVDGSVEIVSEGHWKRFTP